MDNKKEPSLLEFLENNKDIDLNQNSLDVMIKMLEELWFENVDMSKPPSKDNYYIDVYDGWSDSDENNKDRYMMFSASFPSRGMLTTGSGGFLKMWNKDAPIKYNGKKLPTEEYDKFLEYVKGINGKKKKEKSNKTKDKEGQGETEEVYIS